VALLTCLGQASIKGNCGLPGVQMAAAQQYSFTLKGYGPLHDWVRAHTWRMHAPPGDHDVMVTNGNNQTIDVRPLPHRARPAALLPVQQTAVKNARRCA